MIHATASLLAVFLAAAPAAIAGTTAGPGGEPVTAATAPADRPYFNEVRLLDQDGKEVDLYRDLLQGKVVVVNAFFTSCKTLCPMVSSVLARVQAKLGRRLGREVYMVSITLDPEVDTAAKLRGYARHLKARPGWRFVTGPPEAMETALLQLGLSVPNRLAHSGLLMVANEPKGIWRKVSGLSDPDDVLRLIDQVAAGTK